MHHFLEDPSSENDYKVESKVQAFQLARLEDLDPSINLAEMTENIDLEEELKWGKEMQIYRLDFLKKWRISEGIVYLDDLPDKGISALGDDGEAFLVRYEFE